MKLTILLLFLAFAIGSQAGDDLGAAGLAAHVDRLRHMTRTERQHLNDNTFYQTHREENQLFEKNVLEPLVCNDLRPYVPILQDGLNDPDPYIRNYAASLLAMAALNPEVSLKPDGERANAMKSLVPSLLSLTQPNQPEDVRVTALRTLRMIPARMNPMIGASFERAIVDSDSKVRGVGFLGLATIEEKESSIIETALQFLESDEDEENRKLGASALTNIETNDPRVLRALENALNDPSPGVQRVVASVLNKRAGTTPEVAELLKKKLLQPNLDSNVREQIERDMKSRHNEF